MSVIPAAGVLYYTAGTDRPQMVVCADSDGLLSVGTHSWIV